jgi:hypothetical protein
MDEMREKMSCWWVKGKSEWFPCFGNALKLHQLFHVMITDINFSCILIQSYPTESSISTHNDLLERQPSRSKNHVGLRKSLMNILFALYLWHNSSGLIRPNHQCL